MTQKDKELLFKDLCTRLPYKVKVQIPDMHGGYTTVIESIDIDGCITDSEGKCLEVEKVKPYLFPLSSMTEEQEYEWDNLFTDPMVERVSTRHTREDDLLLRAKSGFASTEYLDKSFFDYRGLIPMGLALDATGLNIY